MYRRQLDSIDRALDLEKMSLLISYVLIWCESIHLLGFPEYFNCKGFGKEIFFPNVVYWYIVSHLGFTDFAKIL